MATGADILTHAVKKLTQFLVKEATFLLGVKDDVEWVRLELIWMQSFLQDAEQKQGNNEMIRQWIAEIRSIALETEDIIDDYYTAFKGKELSKRKLVTISNQKFSGIILYNIGDEIKAVKKRLSRVVYDISNIGGNDIQDQILRELRIAIPSSSSSNVDEEEHFVGFDDDILLLEEKLLSNEQMRSVISIYGMSGLGKTSLAWKLYNTYKREFELHAWVSVSKEWDNRDLLERIIRSLKKLTLDQRLYVQKRLKNWNEDDLKRYLQELLKDKRYLVVIDDMWDKEAWECLRSDLPDNQNRSRVIISTHSKLVADLSDERTYVHKLRHLREDESWELFCKNAFSNQNGARSGDLEEIGKEMVAMCDGLPLAITVLGGLLSRKQSNDEWRVFRKRIWRALIDKSVHISALLELSYNDLSHELKSCFLYLGIFPENYAIDTCKLVQLWIAEDLIPPSEGRNLEECAESYIKELNARSLIQLTRSNYQHNSTCRVHDFLRDWAVKNAKELDFFHIYGESLNPTTKPLSTRRIAFRSGFERYMDIDDHSHTQIHTLSFLNYYNSCLDDDDVTKFLTLISTKFKSLRVLDLEGVYTATRESEQKLLEAMGKLVNLRYFDYLKRYR